MEDLWKQRNVILIDIFVFLLQQIIVISNKHYGGVCFLAKCKKANQKTNTA